MSTIQTLHTFSCDLATGPSEATLRTPLMQQDALADIFRVAVFQDTLPVDLTGMTVRGYLYFAASHQTMLLEGEASGQFASVPLRAECYAVPGFASLVIQIQQGNVRHTVLKVNLCIERTGSDNIILPDNVLPTLTELLAQIDAMEQATQAAQEAAYAANAAAAQVNQNTADIQALESRVSALESGDSSSGSGTAASLNLWNYDTTVLGQLDAYTGAVNTSATEYCTTDFIPFSTGEKVYVYLNNLESGTFSLLTPSGGNASTLALYDSSKTLLWIGYAIDGTITALPYTITTENVAYIRWGLNATHWQNANRQYGIFKQAMTAETFDVYSEGSVSDESTGESTNCQCTSHLNGKSILVIGDSLSAANKWQAELSALGATYTNHALGGISLKTMIDGNDEISALSVEEVSGKDAIILFGGTNDMRIEHGEVGSSGGTTVTASQNLWNYETTILGQLNATDGSVNTDATAYCTTDFIPFTTGEQVYVYLNNLETGALSLLTPSEGNASTLALYDSSKNLIAIYYALDGTITSLPYTLTEENVAYIRWGLNASHWQNTNRKYGIFKQAMTAETFDVYSEETVSTVDTVASRMQHAIDRIYEMLTTAGNLTCRLLVVTPYCFGASDYNEDAYTMNGVGLAQIIEDVAAYNGVPVYNAYKRSGINPTTLNVWGSSASDRLHLNAAGYAHLGKLIAQFADENVLD